MELLLQIDRKVKGLGSLFTEALDMDESFVQKASTTQDVSILQAKLQQIILKHIEQGVPEIFLAHLLDENTASIQAEFVV